MHCRHVGDVWSGDQELNRVAQYLELILLSTGDLSTKLTLTSICKHLNFHTESDLVHCDVASVICIHESVLLFSSAKNSSGHQPPGYYWSLLLIGREDNGAEAESRARSMQIITANCLLEVAAEWQMLEPVAVLFNWMMISVVISFCISVVLPPRNQAAEWPVNLLETLEWSPLPNRLGFHKSWSTEQRQYLSISLIREWNLFFRNLAAFPFRDLDLILFSSHAILKLKPGRRFNFVWFKIFIYGMLYNVNCWADEILRNNILWSM